MGRLLRAAPSAIVSSPGARSALCQANDWEGEYRWSPVVMWTDTVPLGVCPPGGVAAAEENVFMNGREAAEAAAIARKSRRVFFDIIGCTSSMAPADKCKRRKVYLQVIPVVYTMILPFTETCQLEGLHWFESAVILEGKTNT
jgi:hypothetical protein